MTDIKYAKGDYVRRIKPYPELETEKASAFPLFEAAVIKHVYKGGMRDGGLEIWNLNETASRYCSRKIFESNWEVLHTASPLLDYEVY